MPPVRNMSTVKPVKTERTHEENQERAYIAASRRSDRSLEARVESARRASEIHKKRTGRSLRVTEQDVINEEMYEEEDDDLPLQYRRLTANLQTGSLDFNRKLAAYLTHNVAVRSALNQALNDSFAQTYPAAQQFPQNPNTMFPSPLTTNNLPAALAQSPQATPTSPHPYRQTPYPMPGAAGFRGQPVHKRANSTALPHDNLAHSQSYHGNPNDQTPAIGFRRMSMPAVTGVKPEIKLETPKPGTASTTSSPGATTKQSVSSKKSALGQMGPPSQQSIPQPAQSFFDFQQANMNPLSMTLPPDAQQLLGASLAPNDPFTTALLGGNHPHQFYPMNEYMNTDFLHGGMNATLAPNAYNMNDASGMGGLSDMNFSGQSPNSLIDFKGVHYAGNPTSGVNTPGENTFDAWINDSWTGDNT